VTHATTGSASELAQATRPKLKLVGRLTRLRVIEDKDIDYLYRLCGDEEILFRWRHQGETLSPQSFAQALWQQVIAQFVIEHRKSRNPLGLVAAYQADFRNGYAYLAVLLDPIVIGTGWILEAPALFITYLFQVFNFRKIYLEVPEYNLDAISSGVGRVFAEEGCLKGHRYLDGRYWNLFLLAIYRDEWQERNRYVRRFSESLNVQRSGEGMV
jgi:RimJ/RimL family protein N-acetyltransferase